MNALWLSLEVAAMTTVAATLFGASAALALARGGLPGTRAPPITAIMLSPLMLPAILTGLALFQTYVLLDVGRSGAGARPYAGVDPHGAHDAGGLCKISIPAWKKLRATSARVLCAPISR